MTTQVTIKPVVVHLKTQRGQPYGSERRCCERCGIMIWLGPEVPPYVDNVEDFNALPEGYVRCDHVEPGS
jgi:hypothetical protein